MRTITGLEELKQAEGEDLGTSDWHEVTQKAIDAFADVTGDHQWIHVDVERAKQTPFGGTIAHGYYTLSLAPMLTEQVFALEGFAFAINYGLNKVRFPAPLPVGKRVRLHAKLKELAEIPGGAQMNLEVTFEVEGGEKPVCVAEEIARVYEVSEVAPRVDRTDVLMWTPDIACPAPPSERGPASTRGASRSGRRGRCRPCGGRGRGPVR